MKDVSTVAAIYCVLFVILTTPTDIGYLGISVATVNAMHHLFAELVFWIAAIYICATGTTGAFARVDRFGLSQNHPILNRLLSIALILSPFLAIMWDARFVYVLCGLLFLSHTKSKTDDEMMIEFGKSRALSNVILMALFTLAVMFMALNNYRITSIFNIGEHMTVQSVEENQDDNA
jgi:hypothetical protein